MKRVIIIASVLVSFVAEAQIDSVYYGQKHPTKKKATERKEKNDAWKERVSWGGNIQAWLGNPTFIFLSPNIGFVPFENFNIGVGAIYNYTSYNSRYGNYSQSIFGGHSFARYTFVDSYFLQIQYDRLLQPDLFSAEPNDKVWVDYLLLGGGFRQSISDKAAVITSIMFNLKQNPLSIYSRGAIIQFGITSTF